MSEIRDIYTKGTLRLGCIFEFRMEQKFEEHGTAYIRAQLNDERVIDEVVDNNPLTVYVETEQKTEVVFSGNIQQISVSKTGQGYGEVEIHLISNTILLDKNKICRSFQKKDLTYEQLAQKVVGAKTCVTWNADKQKCIGRPLIQYYETNWEFLKRISSHLNASVYADVDAKGVCVHVGCDNKQESCKLSSISYKTGISEKFFEYKGRNQREFLYYTIESEENITLGRMIDFDGKRLVVFKKKARLEGSRLIFTYNAGGSVFGEKPISFNKDFIGRVIKGEVIATQNETLRMKMEIDKEQNKAEAYDYPFEPESGNLMYCMPQIGTTVSLYFGDWDERTGRIINCIRTNGDTCSDMSDSNNKTWTTEFNKRLLMNETSLILNADFSNQDASAFGIYDSTGIVWKSQGDLSIIALGKLRYEGKNIVIDTPKKIACVKGTENNTDSSVSVEDDIDIVGDEVKYQMLTIYVYPNIMDAPEIYDNSGLALKIGLGVLAAVGVALVVGVAVVFGAAILATAGVATAAITAAGYGSIFAASFLAGSLAGTTAVGVKAYSETQNNAISDYDVYLAEGAANSAPAALTAGIAAPYKEAIMLLDASKLRKIATFLGLVFVDTNGSYMLTNALLGNENKITEMVVNTAFSFLFSTIGDLIPTVSDEDVLEQGIHGLIKKTIKNEKEQSKEIARLYRTAYGENASPENLAAYLTYLEQHHSIFNGTVPDSALNAADFVNENALISTETQNILGSTVSPAFGEGVDEAFGNEKKDEKTPNREKYTPDGSNVEVSEGELKEKQKEHEESLKERGRTGEEWYVTRGAELRCTCGSHMRRLDVNEDDGYRYVTSEYIYPYIGNTQCFAGEENNIKNFGICNGCRQGETITLIKDPESDAKGKKNRVTGVGCVPELLGNVWFDTKSDATMGNSEELVIQKSFLACKYGGFIEIDTSGIEYMGQKDEGEITQK